MNNNPSVSSKHSCKSFDTHRTITVVLLCLVIAEIAFILYNGFQDASASWSLSYSVGGGFFSSLIHPIHELVKGLLGWTNIYSILHYDDFVRKFAHFTEYGILGCTCAALVISIKRRPCSELLWMSFFVPLFVACLDEFIQSFVGRTSDVADVLLDFSGACCGIFFAIIVAAVWLTLRLRRSRKNI